MSLYFIDRGHDKPDWHKAPYHRYLLCTMRKVAKWQAGWTGDGATVWSRSTAALGGEGFLLERWRGFDIDYGHVVRTVTLPDGTESAFVHPHKDEPPWNVLHLAVWWSRSKVPEWLAGKGVALPNDEFSMDTIGGDYYRLQAVV